MNVSLIITTYNWKEALAVVLQSVRLQVRLPDEVIIADDGSRDDTAEMIRQFAKDFPVPLIHSWQEDKGFRLAQSRNQAIAKSCGDYIIIVDGDIQLPVHFIADHCQIAKAGQFIQGGRVLLPATLSKAIIEQFQYPQMFAKGLRNRKNILRSQSLSRIFSKVRNHDGATRGCNMSFWRADLLRVNGYNEGFVGWGREDSELVIRLLNAGLSRYYLKFLGAGYHLYHSESDRSQLAENDRIYQHAKVSGIIRCEQGLDRHLFEQPREQ
ncbi:glycosyltransferase family 2 protein [Celerinatantimonas yamalensis]|uniref:Glycosyltransferase family 2 protein n=1 Tax=Celerinatantimonas yamalensis TaxID=559956 RepID=A0ABW9GBA9_9GAMM